MVAMAAFIMSSCGNRSAKKAAEVQTVETEVVAACAQEDCCKQAECAEGNCENCKCEACTCAEGNCEGCKCEECKCAETVTCCDSEVTVAETEPVVAE